MMRRLLLFVGMHVCARSRAFVRASSPVEACACVCPAPDYPWGVILVLFGAVKYRLQAPFLDSLLPPLERDVTLVTQGRYT